VWWIPVLGRVCNAVPEAPWGGFLAEGMVSRFFVCGGGGGSGEEVCVVGGWGCGCGCVGGGGCPVLGCVCNAVLEAPWGGFLAEEMVGMFFCGWGGGGLQVLASHAQLATHRACERRLRC
jgi:hypothetical protein